VLGYARHLSSLLLHAAEAILIHETSEKEVSANFATGEFSEDEMRRPTPHTQYPVSLQALYGL
jgi:hypothetical protein